MTKQPINPFDSNSENRYESYREFSGYLRGQISSRAEAADPPDDMIARCSCWLEPARQM